MTYIPWWVWILALIATPFVVALAGTIVWWAIVVPIVYLYGIVRDRVAR